ncbi:MAG: DUF2157 domain-containing protein [Elainellaceae cyanobacterium]
MASDQFRQQLKREAARWRQDDWISPDQHARLAEHYRWEALEETNRGRFTTALVGIGCVLIGIGCITFVSANWQWIPRGLKVALLLTVFLAISLGGFSLLQRPRPAQQRLGQGLMLLAALVLGGNLALMGQLFHQSGSGYGLCLVWGLGTLAMAYGLGLTSLGVLAQILVGIGYLLWNRDVPWLGTGTALDLNTLLQHMPLVTLALFLPLAYHNRSRSIFVLTAIGLAGFLIVSIGQLSTIALPIGPAMALMLTLPVSLLWVYDDRPWLRQGPTTGGTSAESGFRPLSRAIAIVCLGGTLYVGSFSGVWDNAPLQQTSDPTTGPVTLWVSVVTLTAAALWGWIYLGWPSRTGNWGLTSTNGVVLGFLVLMAGTSLMHWSGEPIAIGATVLFNVLLAVLGIGTMREGLDDGDRSRFWCGLTLLVLQIFSRVLEYNTGLLVKSFTFLLCGVAVIVLSLWFERYVRPSNRRSIS